MSKAERTILDWENVLPKPSALLVRRVISYTNDPLNLHAKDKVSEEQSDMDIWKAISK